MNEYERSLKFKFNTKTLGEKMLWTHKIHFASMDTVFGIWMLTKDVQSVASRWKPSIMGLTKLLIDLWHISALTHKITCLISIFKSWSDSVVFSYTFTFSRILIKSNPVGSCRGDGEQGRPVFLEINLLPNANKFTVEMGCVWSHPGLLKPIRLMLLAFLFRHQKNSYNIPAAIVPF